MSKFLTAPQWYDAGGGLNKSLDVNCNGSDTATAFGNGANAVSNGVAVGKGAKAVSAGNFPVSGVAVGAGANTNETVSSFGSVAIGESANAQNDSVAVGRIANANGYGVAVGAGAKAGKNNSSVAIGEHAEANSTEESCIAIGNNAKCVVDAEPYRRIQFLSRTGTNTYINASLIGFCAGSLLDLIYPKGSIYISVSPNNPSYIFGGTWEAFATGKTLVGVDANDTDFNAANKDGGSKTVTLTKDQMPAHNHALHPEGNTEGAVFYVPSSLNGVNQSVDVATSAAGGSQPHDNMPPYITVYMWKRTA